MHSGPSQVVCHTLNLILSALDIANRYDSPPVTQSQGRCACEWIYGIPLPPPPQHRLSPLAFHPMMLGASSSSLGGEWSSMEWLKSICSKFPIRISVWTVAARVGCRSCKRRGTNLDHPRGATSCPYSWIWSRIASKDMTVSCWKRLNDDTKTNCDIWNDKVWKMSCFVFKEFFWTDNMLDVDKQRKTGPPVACWIWSIFWNHIFYEMMIIWFQCKNYKLPEKTYTNLSKLYFNVPLHASRQAVQPNRYR